MKKKLRQLQSGILNSFPVATISMGLDRTITSFNTKAEELTGYTSDEAMGLPCHQVLQSSRCEGGDCPINIESGSFPATGLEAIITSRYGEQIPVRIGTAQLQDEKGHLIGHLEIIEDISREKDLEREKMNFQFMVIHDMKSPLVAMLGLAKRLQEHHDEMDDGRLELYLKSIRTAGEQLEKQVLEFLEYCRQATGKLKLHYEDTDITAILQLLVDRHLERAAEKNITLVTKLANIGSIQGDTQHLQRVFENLLDNAIKFSNPGDRIVMKTKEKVRDIIVEVKDSGPGIPSEELPYIFDAFHTVKSKDNPSGHGLGLSAVKAIVREHNGRIAVESSLGKGSVFTIRLPKGDKSTEPGT